MQKKTQRPVQFEVTEQAREAVSARIAMANLKPEQFRAVCLSHRFSRPGSTPDDRGHPGAL